MADYPGYDEKKLLQLLAGGSEYAFTQIFDRYQGKVYGVALKFLKSQPLAEETVQDVFLKIWLKREELVDIERLDNYLFMMARNNIFDQLRKISRQASVDKEAFSKIYFESDVYDQLQDKHYQQILNEAINELPTQQKQVYLFAKAEGLSHGQIAERMNLSKETVKKHMALALQFIRRYLQSNSDAFLLLFIFGLTVKA